MTFGIGRSLPRNLGLVEVLSILIDFCVNIDIDKI